MCLGFEGIGLEEVGGGDRCEVIGFESCPWGGGGGVDGGGGNGGREEGGRRIRGGDHG